MGVHFSHFRRRKLQGRMFRLLPKTPPQCRLRQPVRQQRREQEGLVVEVLEKKRKTGKVKESKGGVGHRSCIDASCIPFNSLVVHMVSDFENGTDCIALDMFDINSN